MELLNQIHNLFEQIADGYPSTQRFSTVPMLEKDIPPKTKETLQGLKELFAFGVPGGKTKIQKAIGRFLDGDETALDETPTIKDKIIKAVDRLKASKLNEGGKAFKSTTGEVLARPIRKEWVPPTLQQVYNLLDKTGFIDIDSAQPLGSTLWLSKPELGDLDILIKPSRPFDLATFKNALIDFFYLEGIPVRDLAEKGRDYLFDEFSFLFPIIDDSNQLTSDFVQVDLLLAEDDTAYKWRYVWYASPKNSAWKGAARNVLLGIIATARNMVWAKNGLFQKQMVGDVFDYETSNLLSNTPEEAVGIVFGNADISIIESVESMQNALNTQTVLRPLKNTITDKFNQAVAAYEVEGREMRNRRIENGIK